MVDARPSSHQEISLKDAVFLLDEIWYGDKLTEIADAITSNLAQRFPNLNIEDLAPYFEQPIHEYFALQHKDTPLSSRQELTQELEALRSLPEDIQLQLLQSALALAEEHIKEIRETLAPQRETRGEISSLFSQREW